MQNIQQTDNEIKENKKEETFEEKRTRDFKQFMTTHFDSQSNEEGLER